MPLMYELFTATDTFFYIMISFSFFVGILLLVAPEAYEHFNRALQKEYGLKVRLVPQMEDRFFSFIDKTIIKYRLAAGMVISVSAFVLLLLYR